MMPRLRSVMAAAKRSISSMPVCDRCGMLSADTFAEAATSSLRRTIGSVRRRLASRQPARPTSTVSSTVSVRRPCTLRENSNSLVVETVPTSIQWLPSEKGALRLYAESGATDA